jgi:hypothetical protein
VSTLPTGGKQGGSLILRPYQEDALVAVYDYAKVNPGGNALLALPTGTGKAVLIARMNLDAHLRSQADKAVKKPTVVAIANRYLNEPIGGTYVFKFKTKTDAIEAIRRKFIERAQSDSKNAIISRMAGSDRT